MIGYLDPQLKIKKEQVNGLEYIMLEVNIEIGQTLNLPFLTECTEVILFFNERAGVRMNMHVYRAINNNATLIYSSHSPNGQNIYIYRGLVNFVTGDIECHMDSDAPITRILYR